MRSTWLNGMMGLVIGDALGNPVQFSSRDTIRQRGKVMGMEAGGVFRTPAGAWTDDSSMALATLSSIRNKSCIDLHDIMVQFIAWLYGGRYTPFGHSFDQGGTCVAAIDNYVVDGDTYTCGRTGEFANGNGGLMRILPVCLYTLGAMDDDLEAIRLVHDATALTHNHARAKIASGIYYFMAKEVITGSGSLEARFQEGMHDAYSFYHLDLEYTDDLNRYARLFDMSDFAQLDENEIKSSGYVVDTLEAAVWSLITTNSFEEALLKAVNLGNDADTVGAVAGGLAGLYYGYDAIPKEWLAAIQKRDWIETLCNSMGDVWEVPFC